MAKNVLSELESKKTNLQKEIDDLRASISSLESNFYKASLDYEVITSPQNIAALAKKHLDDELIFYKKSQIQEMNKENKINNKLESSTKNKEKNNAYQMILGQCYLKQKNNKLALKHLKLAQSLSAYLKVLCL